MSDSAKHQLLDFLSSSTKSNAKKVRSEAKKARKKLDEAYESGLAELNQEFKEIVSDFEHSVLPKLIKGQSAKSHKKEEIKAEQLIQDL